MTETIESMPTMDRIDQQQFAHALIEQARAEGVELIGPGGLLTGLTKTVLETALEAEITDHLGYDKHDPTGRNGGNSRNGNRAKTVFTAVGPVQIEVLRDRDGSFEPAIVRKRQRRLDGVDHVVMSLTAGGLTTGEVSAHFADVYGATVSKDTISRITDKVVEEMTEWRDRPLDRVYPVLFIDAIMVKVRDGQVTNRPVYVAVGVTCNGEREILGLWAGDGGEGAKFWLGVLTEIKNRGVDDVCIVVCDGLKGLPDSVTTAWPLAVVQTCVIHLLRNSFRFVPRQHWDELAKDLRPIYTAPTEPSAKARFDELAEKWGTRYPAVIRLWRSAWTEFIPFLDYDVPDPPHHLLHQRHREPQRPLPSGDPGPRALPDRAGRVEVPIPRHQITRPDRPRTGPLGHLMEARFERFRDHLRRTYRSNHHQLSHGHLHRKSDTPP